METWLRVEHWSFCHHSRCCALRGAAPPETECWNFLYLCTLPWMPLLTLLTPLSHNSHILCDWLLPRPFFFFFYICGLCFKVVDRGQMCWMRERRHLTGSVVIWTYNTHGDSCYCFEVRTWDSGMLSAHTQLTRNNDWHKLICLLYRRYRNVW